jgi:hypothetical protein
MGTRNWVGIELSYRHVRLAELIPGNRFLGSLKVEKFGLRTKGKTKKEELGGRGAGVMEIVE